MKSMLALCVCLLVALVVARPADNLYTDRYDNVDLDEILGNKKLLVPHIKCILDQGKCTPGAKELKEHIQDALESECAKCTEAQKKGTRKAIKHFINNENAYWQEITAKYDPTNKYSTKYEKELTELKA